MARNSKSSLIVLVVTLLILAPLPASLAYHGGVVDAHNVDLSIESVDVYTTRGVNSEDPDANRADFVPTPDAEVLVRVTVRNDTATGEAARNVTVYVEATHRNASAGASLVDASRCWFITRMTKSLEPVERSFRLHTTAPGEVRVTAYVNNNVTEEKCSKPAWNEGTGSDTDNDANQLSRTLVAGKQPDLTTAGTDVSWCFQSWVNTTERTCGDQHPLDTTNETHVQPRYSSNLTHFRVDVRNLGAYNTTVLASPPGRPGDDGNWTGTAWETWGLRHPNNGSAIWYQVNMTLTRDADGATWYLTPRSVSYQRNVSSQPWDLQGKLPGSYTLTIRVDDTDHLWEENEANNEATFHLQLLGSDLEPTVNRTDLPTSPDDAVAYPESGDTFVDYNVTVANLGNLDNSRLWTWSWFLDRPTTVNRSATNLSATNYGTGYQVEAGGETYLTTYKTNDEGRIAFCDRPDDASCYLTPGKHVLEVDVDNSGNVLEEDETNNRDTVTFYVEDDAAPKVEGWGGPTGTKKAGERISFFTTLTEGDLYLDNVTLHLKVDPNEGNTTTRTYDMDQFSHDPAQQRYEFQHVNETGFDVVGTYTYWVTARDPSGNTVSTFANAKSFTLGKWPVNITIQHPPEGAVIPFPAHGSGDDAYTNSVITTIINGTGVEPAWNETGKRFILYPVGNPEAKLVYQASSNWTDTSACDGDPSNQQPDEPLNGERADHCREDLFSLKYPHYVSSSPPGRWNFTVAVRDAAGSWTNKTSYYILKDADPAFDLANTTVAPDLERDDEGRAYLDAGSTFHVSVRVHDDGLGGDGDHGVDEVFANFTNRSRDFHGNVSLTRVAVNGNNSTWNGTITTGRDGALAVGGFYNVSFHAVDVNGNWNRTGEGDVTPDVIHVRDQDQPIRVDAGVQPQKEQEVAVPFTFFMEARDDTKLYVTLTVTTPNGSTIQEDLHRVGTTDRYEVKRAFDTAGDYQFKIVAKDTAQPPNGVSHQGSFSVADNLPPAATVWRPTVDREGASYFTDTTPALVASVQDPEDVVEDSLQLSIDGTAVNMTNVTVTRLANDKGYNLTYVLPGNYSDGDTIDVAISAQDRSNLNLSGTTEFTLHVDGEAPDTPAPSFAPKYRAGGHVWNISHTTTILLDPGDPGASNNSGSGVDVTKVQFEKESLGSAIVVNGPFHLNEAFLGNDYTGPGLYKLHYWSVDRVGNTEQAQVVQVRLDTSGPQITPISLGTRYVNASISDEQGVTNPLIHVREKGENAYTARNMTFQDGLYRGTLPEVPRDTVLEYYITAEDQIGNLGRAGKASEPYTYVEGNTPPSVRFLSPQDGQVLGGTILVEWDAQDPDESDRLHFNLEYRLAGKGNFRQLAPLNPGETSVDIDTRDLPDGTYELRISVGDGTAFAKDVVTVEVDNNEAVAKPTPTSKSTYDPGRKVHLTAEVLQAADNVTLILERGGDEVLRKPMVDDGTGGDAVAGDHVYTATVHLDKAGTYSWSVEVSYEEGGETRTKRVSSDDTFTVATYGTAGDVFKKNLGLWLAVIVLVLSAAGIGAYAINRSRNPPPT